MRLAAVLIVVASAGIGASAAPQRTVSCTLGVGARETDLPIPTLTPPPSVSAFGIGLSSDSSSFRCSLRYESTLSTSAIAGHVNAQMTTLGWKPVGRSSDVALFASHYLGTASARDLLTAVVIVAALDGTAFHDVAVQITRLDVPADSRPTPPAPDGRIGGGGAGARGAATQTMTVRRGLLGMCRPAAASGASMEAVAPVSGSCSSTP